MEHSGGGRTTVRIVRRSTVLHFESRKRKPGMDHPARHLLLCTMDSAGTSTSICIDDHYLMSDLWQSLPSRWSELFSYSGDCVLTSAPVELKVESSGKANRVIVLTRPLVYRLSIPWVGGAHQGPDGALNNMGPARCAARPLEQTGHGCWLDDS